MTTLMIRGLLLGAFALVACGGADPLTDAPNPAAGTDPSGGDGGGGDGGPTPVVCSTRGPSHLGFGKLSLTADRKEAMQGVDRARLKPYSALTTEVKRVTGQSPPSLAAASSTFGEPEDRWFEEPTASGLTAATMFGVAFETCLGVTKTAADYAAAPSAASAAQVCTRLARTFWSRTAAPAEVDACVQMAVTESASESDPRRRWAYTCATVLSSSGFMAY